jgi:hypothetical protein
MLSKWKCKQIRFAPHLSFDVKKLLLLILHRLDAAIHDVTHVYSNMFYVYVSVRTY